MKELYSVFKQVTVTNDFLETDIRQDKIGYTYANSDKQAIAFILKRLNKKILRKPKIEYFGNIEYKTEYIAKKEIKE